MTFSFSSQAQFFWRRALSALAIAGMLASALPAPALAQSSDKLEPARDAEVEALLRDYAVPIFRAAGIEPGTVQIILIRDFTFNAFVANGRRIFINAGSVVESKTPNELIGVLAHEIGHIAGGHLSNLRQKLDAAQTRAIIAMLLGAAAVVAGASSGASGNNVMAAGQAAILAPQEIIKRDLLSYVRGQEQAADQAAVTYLTKTGQSGRGMLEVFKTLSQQSMFSTRFVDPYAVTHPMPTERIALLERLVNASPSVNQKDSAALQLRHDMARAKIIGFLQRQDFITRRYPPSDTSLPARYARAIATYRFGDVDQAQREIDALIATQSGNPYFWELKGQALLEAGRARLAVAPLQKAVSLAPQAGLIRILLGQALLETGDAALTANAISELRTAIAREPESPDAYRHLAMALGRSGKKPAADLASAQAAFYEGDITLAKQLAARAKTQFANGSPEWLRADDIVSYKTKKVN